MTRLFAIILAVLCLHTEAKAAIKVSEQIMQTGQYVKPGCQPDPKDPDYDSCACDADIRYPQLSGVREQEIGDKFNSWFKNQAAKAVCEGDKMTPALPEKGKNARAHSSVSVHYETTFSSGPLLAFKFTDWAYTGGAHGNGTVIGAVLDMDTGKFLTPADIFGAKNMDAVNEAIYKVLTAKPEEEIFRDQIESRHGAFIKNGECQGCTLILTPQGVHVLFQTYEVAPYGAGNTDVPIPAKYVSNEAVALALNAQKPSAPEKK